MFDDVYHTLLLSVIRALRQAERKSELVTDADEKAGGMKSHPPAWRNDVRQYRKGHFTPL
jgi:hypothetical protein